MAPDPVRIPRDGRLTAAADFDAVRQKGKRCRTATLEVRALASLRRLSRIGIVVPRHGRTAVDRNLVKRRLRELSRLRLWPELRDAGPVDVVIWAFPAAYGVSIDRLAADLARCTDRLLRERTS